MKGLARCLVPEVDINDLYKEASCGDKVARERLFEHLYVSFRLFVRHRISDRQDSEEIVQAAMTKIADRYEEIEIKKSFAAWAHKVLTNEILNHFRARSRHRRRFEEMSKGNDFGIPLDPNPTLKTRLMDCVRKINQTYPRHARILNLNYQGYSTEEICQKLQISPNNFYVILSRARGLLKTCLKTGDVGK
jgi:RNA polymerase sigma factor (sigma-70 family)